MASLVALVPSTPPLANTGSHQPSHHSHSQGSDHQQSATSDMPPLTSSPGYYPYYQQTYHHQEVAYHHHHHASPTGLEEGSYFPYAGQLFSDYCGYGHHHGFDYEYQQRYSLDGGGQRHHGHHQHISVHPPSITSSSSSASSSTSPPRHHGFPPGGDHIAMHGGEITFKNYDSSTS
jgi:hypothetical protein